MKPCPDPLKQRKVVWESKEVLRRLYARWYGDIARWMGPGPVLELGGGSGHLKEHFPEAVSTDVLFEPWLDAVVDAQELPFQEGRFGNVVLFDVLHHLPGPVAFFREAQRVLRPGGRILMMEPFVSALSYPVYRFLHQEGLSMDADPLEACGGGGKDPFEGNQALPGLLFGRYRSRFLGRFPRLRILREKRMDFFVYPLSGGFHHPGLLPLFLWRPMRFLEDRLDPLSRYLAFRLFVVLEKG